jgi:hypothetical protein
MISFERERERERVKGYRFGIIKRGELNTKLNPSF